MYLPDEVARIAKRFIANPKNESLRILFGLFLILLSMPLLHLFIQSSISLADFLNSL